MHVSNYTNKNKTLKFYKIYNIRIEWKLKQFIYLICPEFSDISPLFWYAGTYVEYISAYGLALQNNTKLEGKSKKKPEDALWNF